MRSHAVAASVSVAVLFGATLSIDRVARQSNRPGLLWVVSAEGPAQVLRTLPGDADARIVGVWLDGRLLQLHVASLSRTATWRASAGMGVRIPYTGFLGAMCG